MDPSTIPAEPRAHRPLVVATALTAVLALLALADSIDLLTPVLTQDGGATGIGRVQKAVNAIKGPATITVGSLAGLGILAAAALTAVGAQSGTKIGILSVGSIFIIALGNGLVA